MICELFPFQKQAVNEMRLRVAMALNNYRIADTIQNFVKMDEMTFLRMELHSVGNGVKWWLKIYK